MRLIRTSILLALAVMGIVVAAPAADATGFGAIRGDIEGDFQPTPCPDDSGRVVAWLGTVDIDDEHYGWVEFFGDTSKEPASSTDHPNCIAPRPTWWTNSPLRPTWM